MFDGQECHAWRLRRRCYISHNFRDTVVKMGVTYEGQTPPAFGA